MKHRHLGKLPDPLPASCATEAGRGSGLRETIPCPKARSLPIRRTVTAPVEPTSRGARVHTLSTCVRRPCERKKVRCLRSGFLDVQKVTECCD